MMQELDQAIVDTQANITTWQDDPDMAEAVATQQRLLAILEALKSELEG